MLGPKTDVFLQKKVETYDEGTPSVAWEDISSFKAVLSPISGYETNRYDKQTVNKMFKLGFLYKEPGIDNLSEVREKNRIRIGTRQFDIEWCNNVTDRYWILHIRELDEAIT